MLDPPRIWSPGGPDTRGTLEVETGLPVVWPDISGRTTRGTWRRQYHHCRWYWWTVVRWRRTWKNWKTPGCVTWVHFLLDSIHTMKSSLIEEGIMEWHEYPQCPQKAFKILGCFFKSQGLWKATFYFFLFLVVKFKHFCKFSCSLCLLCSTVLWRRFFTKNLEEI